MSAIRRIDRSLVWLLLLCVIGLPLYAARDSVTARGFTANQVYSFGDIDDVSAMSGNLGVTIPIGQTYTTGGSLSYQFTVRYNSNIWDYIEHGVGSNSVVKLSPSGSNPLVYDAWDDTNPPGGTPPSSAMEAYPARSSNAGMGWIVGFGFLKVSFENSGVPTLIYVAQDGAEHSFYTQMHKQGAELQEGDGTVPYYTRDGSYLRMTRPEGKHNTAAQKVQIHFPDGVQQRFSCDGNCYSFNALWHLDSIADPFGNLLEIKRRKPGQNDALQTREIPEPGNDWVWTFTEYLGTTAGYKTDSNSGGLLEARKHVVTFRVTKKWAHTHQMRVQSIDLAAPHGGRAVYQFAYKDHWIYRDAQHLWADIGDTTFLVTPFETPAGEPGMIQVSLLEEIVFPKSENAGSSSAGKWELDYIGETCERNAPCPELDDLAARNGFNDWVLKDFGGFKFKTTRFFARLKLVVYPTGGAVRYTYKARAFRKMPCNGSGPLHGGAGVGNFSTFLGIRTRELGTFNRVTRQFDREGVWIYDGRGYNASKADDYQNAPCFPVEFVSTEVDPFGKATVSYFSTFIDDPLNMPAGQGYGDFTVSEHGMPYSRLRKDPKDSTRFGSSSIHTCTRATVRSLGQLVGTLNHADEVALTNAMRNIEALYRDGSATCSAQPVRQTFVRYEYSNDSLCDAFNWDGCQNTNRRLQSSRTYFYDDAAYTSADPVYVETSHSEFDGFGHYRRTNATGNLAAKSGFSRNELRESVTRFNPAYRFSANEFYDSATGAVKLLPPVSQPWITGLYDMTAAGENGSWSQARYKFNGSTGFLDARRTLSKTAKPAAVHATPLGADSASDLSENDVLVTWKREVQNGEVVVSEGYSGADAETASTKLSTLLASQFSEPSAGVKYDLQTTMRFGGIRKKEYVGCDAMVLEDNAVDDNTGLVTIARDGSGVTTSYHYDSLGRVTKMFPPYDSDAATCTSETIRTKQCHTVWTYEYPDLPANLVKVKLELQAVANKGLVLDRSWVEYDHYGRVISEEEEFPTVTRAKQAGYFITGHKAWESAGGPKNAAAVNTTRYHYDALGRATCIQHPGNTKTERNDMCINSDTFYTSLSYEGVRQTWRRTGGFAGPLLDGTGTADVTEYMDNHGRLIGVKELSVSPAPVTKYEYDVRDRLVKVEEGSNKFRTFLYDGRGFLTEEDHPELASTKINYGKFDPRGNFGTRTMTGSDGTFDLKYKYDGAEQLVEVRSAAPDRVLKTFAYDGAGRIRQAGRANYVRDVNKTSVETQVNVTVDFIYHPKTGRPTKKTTSGPVTTAVGYEYNALGAVSKVVYPKLESSGVLVDPARPEVTLGYTMGALTSVSPYITAIQYDKSGLATQIARSNGTADVITADPAFPRPKTIQVKTGANYGTLMWSAGTYVYDVNGSVKSVSRGADAIDRFAYDAVGRIKAASLGRDPNAPGAAAAGGVQQDFNYDRWGNLTSMTRQGVPTTYGVDAGTNRLVETDKTKYDTVGNLYKFARGDYQVTLEYGPFNLPKGAEGRTGLNGANLVFGKIYVYDALDERVLVQDYNASGTGDQSRIAQLWTARGASNEVLREFRKTGTGAWTWRRDHVFRGSAPAVAIQSDNAVHHLHTDHLGTPRYVTGGNAKVIDYRLYLPFGEEVQPRVDANEVRLKFTSHERDDDGTLETIGDLDYMHARYYSAPMGRFLAIDPMGGKPASPQSFNRYAYSRNNPTTRLDPDGRSDVIFVQRVQELLDRYDAAIPHLERAAASFNRVPILRPVLAIGPKFNIGPLRGELGAEASVKHDSSSGETRVEARGGARLQLGGTKVGASGKGSVLVHDDRGVLPDGVDPSWGAQAEVGRGRFSTGDVKVRFGAGVGLELGIDYGSFIQGIAETVQAVREIGNAEILNDLFGDDD